MNGHEDTEAEPDDAGVDRRAAAPWPIPRPGPDGPRAGHESDFADTQPAFALGAGLLALHWLVQGYGYEITGADVWTAYSSTMKAAKKNGNVAEIRERVKKLVAADPPGGFVAGILGRALEL